MGDQEEVGKATECKGNGPSEGVKVLRILGLCRDGGQLGWRWDAGRKTFRYASHGADSFYDGCGGGG